MMRVGVREVEILAIVRFMGGLNLKIRDKVEILSFQDLNDLLQLCIRVEQQNLRKSYFKRENFHKREG